MPKRNKDTRNTFERGVRMVAGSDKVPGVLPKWDINYQVDGHRETKRIEAENYSRALEKCNVPKAELRKRLGGAAKGEPLYEIEEIYKKLERELESGEELGTVAKKTKSGVLNPFKRFYIDYPKHLGLVWRYESDATVTHYKEYRKYYGIDLNKPTGAGSEMRKLKTVYTWIHSIGCMSFHRLAELHYVKCPKKNVTPYIGNPEEDWDNFFTLLRERYPRTFDFLCFLERTGRRPGEVRTLLRGNVRELEECIFVPGVVFSENPAKNREPSLIPYNAPDLRKIMQRVLAFSRKLGSEILFLNEMGRPFSAGNPLVIVKKLAKELGIPNWNKWTVYQLKKRMITLCRRDNLVAENIEAVTGHKDLNSVIKHYSFPDKTSTEQVFKSGKPRAL